MNKIIMIVLLLSANFSANASTTTLAIDTVDAIQVGSIQVASVRLTSGNSNNPAACNSAHPLYVSRGTNNAENDTFDILYSALLAAHMTGREVKISISSTVCINNNPKVIFVEVQ